MADENWVCKECNLQYSDKLKQKWLECAGCLGKFDSKCQKITANQYQTLDDRNDILWLCKPCVLNLYPDPATGLFQGISDKPQPLVSVMNDKICNLTEQLQTMKQTIDIMTTTINQHIDNRIDNLNSSLTESIQVISNEVPKETSRTWADLLKKETSRTNTITIDNMKKAIEEVTEVDREKELRSRGIVIYRAEEAIRPSNDTNNKEDDQLVRHLVDYLQCDTEQLISVNRLGRFSSENIAQGRFRPLKIRFKTQEARDNVLNSLSKLRDAPAVLNKLSIRQDLNLTQRQELSDKIKEAREKSKDLSDSFFRVKGSPGDYRLVEIKKK